MTGQRDDTQSSGSPQGSRGRGIRCALPPSARRCGYCHRPIHKQRNGAWYHDRNSSVACDPGSGDGRKAWPT